MENKPSGISESKSSKKVVDKVITNSIDIFLILLKIVIVFLIIKIAIYPYVEDKIKEDYFPKIKESVESITNGVKNGQK